AIQAHADVDVVTIPPIEDSPEGVQRGVEAFLASGREVAQRRVLGRLGAIRPPTEIVERDAAHVWHPYTQHGLGRAPLPVIASKGAWLTLGDGRRVLDGVSSWWTTLHGHGNDTIAAAIAEQVRRIDHVQFGGMTHAPAVALAQRLLQLAPPGLARVFY